MQEKLDQKYQDLNFEVINTGVSGLRANNHIATLKKILKYNPDMAIFLIGINDWNHDIKHNHKSGYKKFKDNLPDFMTGLSYDKTLRKFIILQKYFILRPGSCLGMVWNPSYDDFF